MQNENFRMLSIPMRFLLVAFAWFAVGAEAVIAEVDFNHEVRPILAENCFQCHGPDASQRQADLRLDVEAEAKNSAWVIGNALESEFLNRVNATDPELLMPPPSTGKLLSDREKSLLAQWVDEGAKYSRHWAFEPIPSSESLLQDLPGMEGSVENPIDRFLLQKLSEAGLKYSSPVGKAEFVRRATFDLTGLPPTWEEVQAYVNDHELGHVSRLIDRLLESKRYGERWGRHWLDIARYADTHGGAAIGFTTFPFSYTYRDYVIQAFNADLPFDQFIVEQIAADQLGLDKNSPALAGVGFLTVGMQFRNYHDTIDDKIDVISRGLMGLTVSCARCHDHKFDEIPTTDYYSLYATIAPSQAPEELPTIGSVDNQDAAETYQQQLHSLKVKLDDFSRDQSEVMRGRLRMQVGLYLREIAKGVGEQDVSTQFLSYRTDDIRPLILNRWIDYLDSLTASDPVFGPWKEMQAWGELPPEEFSAKCTEYLSKLAGELSASGKETGKIHALREDPPIWNPLVIDALVAKQPSSLAEVAEIYGLVFAEQQRMWFRANLAAMEEAVEAGGVLPDDHPEHLVINSPTHRQLRRHLYSAGSPCDVPGDVAMGLTNRTISDLINAKRDAIHQLNLSAPGAPPRAMILEEDPSPKPFYVFLRGNPLSRGVKVEPAFLSAVPNVDVAFEDGKRRLGLARAIVSEENPLTSRVIVNWAWRHHFGYGLVRTPDDFGTRGQPPTHPELLDYLAKEFQNQGWSMKWLHRQIMLSTAYQQASVENEISRERDPENHLWWRMPRRRLDFESMRDAMLSVTDELDLTMGGKPIDLNASPSVKRRSVYGFINRDIVANLLSTFDTANPNACTAKRPETTVPQQTLFALNSEFIQDCAQKVAENSRTSGATDCYQRITAIVRKCFGREPTPQELLQAEAFLKAFSDDAVTSDVIPEPRWAQFTHALLASNEFIFVD